MTRRIRPLRRRKLDGGASLITAVFLITALAVVGALLSRVLVTSSTETVTEMYSAQALAAAESGIDFAAYQLATGNVAGAATGPAAVNAVSWFTTAVVPLVATASGGTLYQITSTGTAGGTSAAPVAQRTLVVDFKP